MTHSAVLEISPGECLSLVFKGQVRGVDVRAEGEFAKGHLPGFVNLPILKDDERARVGTTYKQVGNEEAVRLGHELVGPHKSQRVAEWLEAVGPGQTGLVACWRGGMRSRIASEWMAESASTEKLLRAHGGYKAMRAEFLPMLRDPGPLWVLSGLTGCGKTDLIRSMPREVSLDLEGMAHHRGSSFGRHIDEPQPAQATFENRLGLQLWGERHLHVVEDESLRIGNCMLTPEFKDRMYASPMILLEDSVESRAERIFREYVLEPLAKYESERVRFKLVESVGVIRRKLGGEFAAELVAKIDGCFLTDPRDPEAHARWIAPLLTDYYDKLYRHSMEKCERNIIFKGNWKECREWILENWNTSS